jgi:hypothetical protein
MGRSFENPVQGYQLFSLFRAVVNVRPVPHLLLQFCNPVLVTEEKTSIIGMGRVQFLGSDFLEPLIDFSPAGKTLAVLAGGGPVALWDFQSGKDITPPEIAKEFSRNAPMVAFSPIGTFLAGMGKIVQERQ